MGVEAKETYCLRYLIPDDALRTREWLNHAIKTLDSSEPIPKLDARRFTAFVDGIALAFFSALNACSYAALIVVDTLADLIKAHPIDACYSASQNLVKAIGAVAAIFFGLYVALCGIAASHERLQAYLPINPKTTDELLDEAKQNLANLKTQNTNLLEKIRGLETQKRESEGNVRAANQELENLKTQNTNLLEKIRELETQNVESERNAGAAKQELTNLESKKLALEGQIRELETQKGGFEANIEEANQKLTNLNAQNTSLEEQIRGLETQKRELEHSIEEAIQNLAVNRAHLEEQLRALNNEKTRYEAVQMHMHLLEQKLEIMQLKSDIKRLERLIRKSQVSDKESICKTIERCQNSSLETSATAAVDVDHYTYVDDPRDNANLISCLRLKKQIRESQLEHLASIDEKTALLRNRDRFKWPGYEDPSKAHKFTVHLDHIAKVVGHDDILVEMGSSPLAKALLEPQNFSTPAERYSKFVEALRETSFENMTDCHKKILLVHMSGVEDHDYLAALIDRILAMSPISRHQDLLTYLQLVNQAATSAPEFFLAGKLEQNISKGEGAIGTKDFLGVDGGNLPNLRGMIQFSGRPVAFLRAPTPSKPYIKNKFVKYPYALGNRFYSCLVNGDNGNGEVVAPEERAFCQALEERDEAMLVAVHECLFPNNVERGRCLLRINELEQKTSSYQALFQPYDGPLYNDLAGNGTFGAMEEKLVDAYCHNDINNKYGCLLPLAIRKDEMFLKEYEAELRKLVGYVKKVYFNDAGNEEKIELFNYKIPNLLKNKYYKETLMGQRAFLHFFYIAQSEHMMVWLNDKLGDKKLTHFKSQCKDAQDRTGMEALVQETQYAMRSQSGDMLYRTIAHIIKKNVGQCLANKGMAFHGERFTLGAIVFGYLLERFKIIPKAFTDCEHLPDNEKISGMNVNLIPGNVAEVTHKNANCISTYLNALKFYYHTDVRPISVRGSSGPSDEFNWKGIDSFIPSDVIELSTERKYVLNGIESESAAITAPALDMVDIKRYMSIASEDKLLELMRGELENDTLGIQVSLVNRANHVYSYRNVQGRRAFVLSMPLAIKRGEEVIAEAEAYLQVNLSMLKEKRAKNGSYNPPIAPIRWAWRLKEVDNQKPTDSVLGIEI
ncbi:MAG: hypothetical protein KDK50_03230 [Chlamydiia bacterium]|nr:hypothetical protein [Chlamydiia bacterium]